MLRRPQLPITSSIAARTLHTTSRPCLSISTLASVITKWICVFGRPGIFPVQPPNFSSTSLRCIARRKCSQEQPPSATLELLPPFSVVPRRPGGGVNASEYVTVDLSTSKRRVSGAGWAQLDEPDQARTSPE
ncbi:uncharacterized protein SPSK_05678 [Sporothrix schenckii 1099-18]|uniref:Uncharacterized protein n=1 Tax=Sporothrix schenckii 1099-18 TaxID=1397361 RepID=A0A0F2LU82_SPOSC|nr:uncharacterized protein SPSK_05678 [Sporothrix schenckii 1099-18]KJR81012.1 hypothetical protein SPSK_05678 [Sporothrix schenckii 1099-18]